jgi:hypothetical protein
MNAIIVDVSILNWGRKNPHNNAITRNNMIFCKSENLYKKSCIKIVFKAFAWCSTPKVSP